MSEPTLGARIRAARAALGLTQADVSKKLGYDTTGTVSRWERDVLAPNEQQNDLLQKHLFNPAAKLDAELKSHVNGELEKIPTAKPPAPKAHSKEQLILSVVELTRNPAQFDFVENLLLGAKAQAYTIDSLIGLLKQIRP